MSNMDTPAESSAEWVELRLLDLEAKVNSHEACIARLEADRERMAQGLVNCLASSFGVNSSFVWEGLVAAQSEDPEESDE